MYSSPPRDGPHTHQYKSALSYSNVLVRRQSINKVRSDLVALSHLQGGVIPTSHELIQKKRCDIIDRCDTNDTYCCDGALNNIYQQQQQQQKRKKKRIEIRNRTDNVEHRKRLKDIQAMRKNYLRSNLDSTAIVAAKIKGGGHNNNEYDALSPFNDRKKEKEMFKNIFDDSIDLEELSSSYSSHRPSSSCSVGQILSWLDEDIIDNDEIESYPNVMIPKNKTLKIEERVIYKHEKEGGEGLKILKTTEDGVDKGTMEDIEDRNLLLTSPSTMNELLSWIEKLDDNLEKEISTSLRFLLLNIYCKTIVIELRLEGHSSNVC